MLSTSAPLLIRPLLARFEQRRPIRAGSLIITLYGDAIAPRGGSLWLGSLNGLVGPFGIEPGLVRTALSRLVDAGQGQWVYLPQCGPGAPKARRFVLPGVSGDPVYRTPAGDAANRDSVCVDGVDTSASTPAGGAA